MTVEGIGAVTFVSISDYGAFPLLYYWGDVEGPNVASAVEAWVFIMTRLRATD